MYKNKHFRYVYAYFPLDLNTLVSAGRWHRGEMRGARSCSLSKMTKFASCKCDGLFMCNDCITVYERAADDTDFRMVSISLLDTSNWAHLLVSAVQYIFTVIQ